MPIDYQLGKIYKIICNTTGLVYIGSTCEATLEKRLDGHVRDNKRFLAGKYCYVTSFKIIQNDNYNIVLIEKYPCASKDELHARERYYTNQIECVNKNKNQGLFIELGKKQYFEQYVKEYYIKNKMHLKERHECVCGGCYTLVNKGKHIKTKTHQKYMSDQNKKWSDIKNGLCMIIELDKVFEDYL